MYVDLRAQLVPIVAAFVALGIGILIGGMLGADQGVLLEQRLLIEDLEAQFEGLRRTNEQFRARVSELEVALAERDRILETVLPYYLAPRAAELRLAVLKLGPPNRDDDLVDRLRRWGAEVLVVQLVPSGTRRTMAEHGAVNSDVIDVLRSLLEGAWESAQMRSPEGLIPGFNIGVEGAVAEQPHAVLLLVDPAVNRDFGTLLTPLVATMKADGLHVVAAETSRSEETLVDMWHVLNITTVDHGDTPLGMISLVFALEGATGHFGTGPTAQGLVPALEGGGW